MKIKTLVFLLFCIFALNLSFASGSTYLQADLKLREGIKGDSSSFLTVDKRKIEIKQGLTSTLFIGNFSLNMNYQKIDSTDLSLNLALFTLPPEMDRIFKEFLIGLGHTYTIRDIKLKQGQVFNLELTPERFVEKEDSCNYLITDSLWLYNNKVIHFAITYMENSFADYFFNLNKNYLEADYKKIKHYFKFSYPQTQKIDYFICPCEIPEPIWDPRLNISLDPSKHKIYVLFDKEKESVDFPGPLLLLLYEFWGYAPAFVAEGASGYFGMNHYYAKKLKEKDSLIPLSELKVSLDYRKAPVWTAFNEASSFVSFLIGSYNMDTFRRFYSQVTDLDFDSVFERVYSKKFSQMEKDWLSFLDRYQAQDWELESAADRKSNYRYYADARELLQDVLKIYVHYSEKKNILRVLNKIGEAYLFSGDYKEAQKIYQQMSAIDTLSPGDHLILGNLYLLQGEKDWARAEFHQAIKLDTTYSSPLVKLAQIYLDQGDVVKAKENFEKAKKLKPSALDQIEIYSGLGKMYSGANDSAEAQENLYLALQASNYYLQSKGPSYAPPYLKIGEIYLSLGAVDSALATLKIAEFLEDSPAYLGEIYLNLGEAYRQKGEKDKARSYYQQVLLIPSGANEKTEARERLKSVE